jgi:uncharacterized membrane protein YoaK (UPF0700 family)
VSGAPAGSPGSDEALPRFLLGLTFVTGMVDAATFLGLGQVFAAMMTGNVLFLGFGIAGTAGAPFVAPLVALAAFTAGGAVGSLVSARAHALHRRGLLGAVGAEGLLVGLAAVLAATVTVETGELSGWALIAILALTMGLRNTVVRRLGATELTTTVLTVAVTRLQVGSDLAVASREHLLWRWSGVAAMLAGAAAGALLLKESLAAALGVAAALSFAAIAVYAAQERRWSSA